MMRRLICFTLFCYLYFYGTCTYAQLKYPAFAKSTPQPSIANQISAEYMPVIGVWQWNDRVLQQGGYKTTINQISANSPFNLLVTFFRFPDKEIVDDVIYEQMKLAAEYAIENNLGLVPDLDLRSARRAFRKEYPDELQEMLRLQEVNLADIFAPHLIEFQKKILQKYSDVRLSGVCKDEWGFPPLIFPASIKIIFTISGIQNTAPGNMQKNRRQGASV